MCVLIRIATSRRFLCVHTIYYFYDKIEKITADYSKSAVMGFFFLGTQERVRNSRGKRAISVRATEVLILKLYNVPV